MARRRDPTGRPPVRDDPVVRPAAVPPPASDATTAGPVPAEGAGLPARIGERLPFDPAWCLVVAEPGGGAADALGDELDEQSERSQVTESLLTVADGVIGTRGVLEEDAGDGAVVAAGLYQPAGGVGERLVPMPSWCRLDTATRAAPGRRVLDLRDGLLTREAGGPAGGSTGSDVVLRTARFACIARPGTAVLAAAMGSDPSPPDNQPAGTAAADDSQVFTSPAGGGVARSTRTSWVHDATSAAAATAGELGDPPGDPAATGGTTTAGTATVGATTATTTTADATGVTPGSGAATAPGGRELLRVACHAVDPVHPPDTASAEASLAAATSAGGRALLAEQRRAWQRRWAAADVAVPADPRTTLAARFAIFHVLSSAARTGEAAVGARGLTGPAYAGHVFWDTEAFVLPVLAAVDAAGARAVLEYRIRRLGAARRAAAACGRAGARFPWESASTGADVTPRWGLDQRGVVVPIHTGEREEHVTADVAWAAWHYAAWQGSWDFLHGRGRPLLVETARYWASRVAWDASGRAHVDGVIGPDEYHEHVDDNAFTNLMARANLRRAADLVERTGPSPSEADEAEAWRRTADALVDGLDPATGRYEQFAGFDRLEHLPVAALGTPPLAADLVLDPDRLAATTILKQADVLMAHLLVPEETAPGSLAANLDHYLPFTAHGSSLSPAVHATLLARAGRSDEALELLDVATAIDLHDLTQTTGGGLHLANLAGVWRVLVQGFAGVAVRSPDDRALTVEPRLPARWPELRVSVRWHGRTVHLRCRHDGAHVACDRPVDVDVHGTRAHVEPPGRWVG